MTAYCEEKTPFELQGVGIQERLGTQASLDLTFQNEETLLDPGKRHDLSARGFIIMEIVAKHLLRAPIDAISGMAKVNIAALRKTEAGPTGKIPFRLEEFNEIARLGYSSVADVKSPDEAIASIKTGEFMLNLRFQRLVRAFEGLNAQKRSK